MGRRTLRFDVRKNCERKKRGTQVSTVQNKSVIIPDETIPTSKSCLKLSIPSSYYRSADAPDVSVLCTRMQKLGCLPMHWTSTVVSGTLVLTKLRASQTSAKVVFLLPISEMFSWALYNNQRSVNLEKCQVLCEVSSSLKSVDDVISVLRVLDATQQCVGNPDEKFRALVDRRRGEFRDRTGKLLL